MDATAAPSRIATLHTEHVEHAATVVQTAFDNEYSWSRPLNMPQERFLWWMRNMYLPERVSSVPASLVATSEGGSVVDGVCTLEDFFAPEQQNAEEEADPPAGMRCVEAILLACKEVFYAEAQRRGLELEKGRTGVVGYVAFLAVSNSVRRQRVGHRLVEHAVQQLTTDGYRTVVAFCTSFKSAQLFRGLGFQRWGGVGYQEFKMPDGSNPFVSLPVDECAVMVLTTAGAP